MNVMTVESLIESLTRTLLVHAAPFNLPIRVIQSGEEPWVSAIAGVAVFPDTILLILGDDLDPASSDEIDARDDLVGAP